MCDGSYWISNYKKERKVKKTISLLLIIISYNSVMSQHLHKKNPITMSIGHGGLNNLNLQFEKQTSNIHSIGTNLRYYYTIQDKFNIKFTGPMFEIFGRYYFDDQLNHIGNFFLQIDASYGKMTLPSNSNEDDLLYDINNILVLDETGNMIQLYNGKLYRSGAGISIGYKNISCKDWIWEVNLGYDYWQAPQYYSEEYLIWIDDNCCNLTNYKESKWTNGFPIDLQLRIGKVIQ